MNENRRREISRAISHLEMAKNIVSDVLFEEQNALDNMPENLQSSSRYEAMESAVDALSDAESSIDEAVEYLEAAVE